jgi:fucose permease
MPWFYLAIAFYVAAEIGMASWLVTFLQEQHHQSVTVSNQSLSLFFAMIMTGRFLGGFVVHRIGYLHSIFFAALGALTFIALGLFGSDKLYFFLPLTGFFLSIIFPTLTAAVTDISKENTNTVLGLLFTFAGLGGLLGPWLVGWGSDLFGLQSGFAINLIFAVLLLVSILVLLKERKYGKNP